MEELRGPEYPHTSIHLTLTSRSLSGDMIMTRNIRMGYIMGERMGQAFSFRGLVGIIALGDIYLEMGRRDGGVIVPWISTHLYRPNFSKPFLT